MKKRILRREITALVIVDVQDAFRKSIPDFDTLVRKTRALAKGFEVMGLPVLITEQYPKGLGHTAVEIADSVEKAEYFEKSGFSACLANGFEARLRDLNVEQVAVAGIEAHVCVNQSVHGLLRSGFGVHLIEDVVASRHAADRDTALRKMYESGAVPSTVEMALFELLVDSADPNFKQVQSLIK